MKNRRGLTAVAMAGMRGAMTLASSFSAYAAAGWVQSGNTYVYYDSDGSLHKGWLTHPMDIITPIFLPVRW